RRRSRVGVTGGNLHVAERHACIERCHDESGAQHVWIHRTETSAASDRSDPTVSGASVKTLTVAATQDGSFVELADGKIDSARCAGHKRDDGGLVAFPDDAQCSMAAFEREVFDVRGARFGDSQAVESEEYSERGVGVLVAFGGE